MTHVWWASSGQRPKPKQIKEYLETFLCDSLKLELSKEKTLITHATSQAARFLGYELVNQQANDQFDPTGRRRVNGRIGWRVPADVIEQHCRAYMRNGKPAHRRYLDTYNTVRPHMGITPREVINLYLKF